MQENSETPALTAQVLTIDGQTCLPRNRGRCECGEDRANATRQVHSRIKYTVPHAKLSRRKPLQHR